ncbi:MAG: ArsA family ATPase [Deltaproteobacteria bacterium]|nr:ArsA family ATPase [Deltaproteobacteria bacterium]
MNLQTLIEEKKLIICCGSGGVGKTTTAAALGLKAALSGKKVAVLTVDPAKRLANSLGISSLGNEEKEIDISRFQASAQTSGKFFAAMLDTKRTFDKIIERYAPNEEARNNILGNALYQHLSSMIAGSQEYMAMERVYEMVQKDKYDLLILDTPPTAHALDFLEAPQKMSAAVGDSMLKWFLKPGIFVGKSSLKLLEKGAQKIFGIFGRVLGMEFLQDLSTMLISTGGLLEGFKERAEEVSGLLKNSDTAFLLVAAPQGFSLNEALMFYEKMKEFKLPFSGLILNRIHPRLKKKNWQALNSFTYKKKLSEMFSAYEALADQEAVQIEWISQKIKGTMLLLPHMNSDIHDLESLKDLGDLLM